jgi:hypothetical protein
MLLIIAKKIIPKGFSGLTFFPFVILRQKSDSQDKVLMNHERIHLCQQMELLVLPFYIWYLFEYLLRLLYYRKASLAYRNICFEREAYLNEFDFDYLKKRSFFGFLKYLRQTK